MARTCILSLKSELICAKVSDPQWGKSISEDLQPKLTSSVLLSCMLIYLDKD